ncbi:MAG: chemotaxis protein [Firmicutes bacterium]|nr:chemotaxis protein [Bacillota bacterium]
MHLNGTELVFPVKVGDPVMEGGVASAAMKEGRRVTRRVGREVFGIPYIGIGTPLKDEKGRVIGALVTALPITMQEEINNLIAEMDKSLVILENTTATVAAASQEYSATVANLEQTIEDIKTEMGVVDSILVLIREISDQTHLLGLNAAIEAARAGDLGRGFNVVAGEIRKLASKTRDSLKQINLEMEKIINSVGGVAGNIHQIAAAAEEQTATAIEISEATSKLKEDSGKIFALAQKLLSR